MKYSQKRADADKRHQAMFDLYQRGLKYAEIAKVFEQSRATVMHGIKKIESFNEIYKKQ